MKTAVNMEAKPIQVKMASFPSVRILAASAVQIAATMVQTTVQARPPARILSPCARPRKPEPVARLSYEARQNLNITFLELGQYSALTPKSTRTESRLLHEQSDRPVSRPRQRWYGHRGISS